MNQRSLFWFSYLVLISFLVFIFFDFVFSSPAKTSFAKNFYSNKDERRTNDYQEKLKASHLPSPFVPDAKLHGENSGYHKEGTPYHRLISTLHQTGSTYHYWPSETEED